MKQISIKFLIIPITPIDQMASKNSLQWHRNNPKMEGKKQIKKKKGKNYLGIDLGIWAWRLNWLLQFDCARFRAAEIGILSCISSESSSASSIRLQAAPSLYLACTPRISCKTSSFYHQILLSHKKMRFLFEWFKNLRERRGSYETKRTGPMFI